MSTASAVAYTFDALREQRRASFVRLKGGFAIPLAGVVYWVALGILGHHFVPVSWGVLAFVLSGAIFPLALLFGRIFGVNFMRDRTAVSDVLIPTFVAMLLFWPIAISALWQSPQMVPLVLAIGLSQHWPVIGWSYGKTALYSAHAVLRAVGAFILWNWFPSGRFTVLPFWVAGIYAVTVVAILITVRRERRKEVQSFS